MGRGSGGSQLPDDESQFRITLHGHTHGTLLHPYHLANCDDIVCVSWARKKTRALVVVFFHTQTQTQHTRATTKARKHTTPMIAHACRESMATKADLVMLPPGRRARGSRKPKSMLVPPSPKPYTAWPNTHLGLSHAVREPHFENKTLKKNHHSNDTKPTTQTAHTHTRKALDPDRHTMSSPAPPIAEPASPDKPVPK